jgi:hypothetical protein
MKTQKSREAEKQASTEKQKSGEAQKQRSSEKQKRREAGNQKLKKKRKKKTPKIGLRRNTMGPGGRLPPEIHTKRT